MKNSNQGTSMPDTAQTALPGGDNVLVEIEDGIAWVTLNRPDKRNAISPALSQEMNDVLDALEGDDRCGLLVLTGAGQAYCAGMDLKEFFRELDKMSPEARAPIMRMTAAWQWRKLNYYSKPTICMVNGWCFGAGFNSMTACDLAIADEGAKFGLSEINWGMIPAGNVMKNVAANMNLRDSMYYTMTGETFDGKQAAAMGLVNEAVPTDRLRARTTELAKVLLDKNPSALRAAKHACRRVRDFDWDQAEDYLFAKLDQMRFMDSEGGREQGMKQFLDDKTYRPGLGNYKRES